MNFLFLITARGGSKGIPGKNIKQLGGKPLICYSIDIARCFTADENICLSTDSEDIIQTARKHGLNVPFIRPSHLATDTSGSYEVLLHALEFYEAKGKKYDAIVLLQPTSPFRLKTHVEKALSEFTADTDMVVSVKESHANPELNMFKENAAGYLEKYLPGNYTRRQDAPKSYQYNGAIYIIRAEELKKHSLHEFQRIKKVLMDDLHSVDIDTPMDWLWAEFLLNNGHVKLDDQQKSFPN
jgi:CMP-N,N'-diacetyllegionaminic acid synthase